MRGLKDFARGAVFLAGLLGLSSAALAGTAGAFSYPDAPVKAITDKVTYSKSAEGKNEPLETYIGFLVGDATSGVLLKNVSGNTVNNVRIRLTVTGSDTTEHLVLYRPADYLPSGCVYDATWTSNPYEINCSFKQLKSNAEIQSFYVFFVTPKKSVNGISDEPGTDKLSTKLEVFYSEGTNGPSPVEPNSTIDPILQADLVTLGTDDPVNVRSAVPETGGMFFTGSGAPKGLGDPISTAVTIPKIPTAIEGQIFEGDSTTNPSWSNVNCLNNFKACYYSQITVPGEFTSSPYFQVTFRISPENFLTPGLKIEGVTLYYRTTASSERKEIKPCNPTDKPWLQGPDVGTPCWSTRQQYRKNYRQNPDLSEVMEWKLLNTSNGFLEFD